MNKDWEELIKKIQKKLYSAEKKVEELRDCIDEIWEMIDWE